MVQREIETCATPMTSALPSSRLASLDVTILGGGGEINSATENARIAALGRISTSAVFLRGQQTRNG